MKNADIARSILPQLKQDLNEKMVLLSGPRQVGKTTLSKGLLEGENGVYLNWDIPTHREQILRYEIPDVEFLIFDEIHKFKKWRNFLKGVYDEHGKEKRILVTGSARLELLRYGGDSLQGRYHLQHLLPLSCLELGIGTQGALDELYSLSGFPEPFFSSSKRSANRWSMQYRSLLLQEEVEKVERVNDISNLELMLIRLPELVGSPLSINSLREDLQVNHGSCASWLNIFERLYAIFRLSPFGYAKLRAVKKEQKHYHLDWNLLEDEGNRFENFIAVHLLKHVTFLRDTEGRDIELRYFRDTDSREVDFVVCEKRKPLMFVECKLSATDIDKSLSYIQAKFPEIPCIQVHLRGDKDYVSKSGIRVMPALRFLREYLVA